MTYYRYKEDLGTRLDSVKWITVTDRVGGGLSDNYLFTKPTILINKPIILIDDSNIFISATDQEVSNYTLTGTFVRTQDWASFTAHINTGGIITPITITNDYIWAVDITMSIILANTSKLFTAYIEAIDPFTGNTIINSNTVGYLLG